MGSAGEFLSLFLARLPISLALSPIRPLTERIPVIYTAFLFGAGDVLAQQGIEKRGKDHDVGPFFLPFLSLGRMSHKIIEY